MASYKEFSVAEGSAPVFFYFDCGSTLDNGGDIPDFVQSPKCRIRQLETEVAAKDAQIAKLTSPYIGIGDENRPTLVAIGGWWVRLMLDKETKQHYLQLKKTGVMKLCKPN